MTYSTTQKFSIIFVTIIIGMVLQATIPLQHEDSPTINKEKAPAAVVEMTNTMKFTPDTVRITKGQTVKWNNTSLLAHSVTADPAKSTIDGSVQLPDGAKSFDSGMLDPKQTFQHTFNKTGTYQYFCIPHEGAKMFGWVIVTPDK
jgi:plastocyanin